MQEQRPSRQARLRTFEHKTYARLMQKNSTLSRITRICFRIYFVAGLRPIKTKKQHPFRFFFMKSARRVAVILWMTLLCRSNDRAGRRDFEPSSPGLGSFNAKNSTLLGCCFFCIKKARDGDRTRGPLLGKEVLHH